MIPNAIEREIVIDAPVDVVWRIVTEPREIVRWFSDEAEIELRVGGAGRLKFRNSGDSYQLQVEVVEPPHRFVWRWVQPEGEIARQDNSMLVEFTLRAEGAGTRLRVVESGFDHVDWSDERKAKYADNHTRGWHTILDRLRDYAPRA
jgi:uncharacterized protein YndB with AHSA1/START domain